MAQALLKARATRSIVQAVCLAVSGVNHPSDQERIRDWLRLILFLFYSHLPFLY